MSIHPSLRKYFWEINPQKARPKSYPEYYLKRLLELGDKKALAWAKKVFGLKKMRKVALKARLSSKSANYWRLFLK